MNVFNFFSFQWYGSIWG